MTTTNEGEKELKLCIHCRNYNGILRTCRAFTWGRSMVDGEIVMMGAVECRSDAAKCGRDASQFEALKQPF